MAQKGSQGHKQSKRQPPQTTKPMAPKRVRMLSCSKELAVRAPQRKRRLDAESLTAATASTSTTRCRTLPRVTADGLKKALRGQTAHQQSAAKRESLEEWLRKETNLRPADSVGKEGGGSSSDGSSESSEAERDARHRTRLLKQRARHRLKKYLEEMLEGVTEGLTFLERRAVSDKVKRSYRKEVAEFTNFAAAGKLELDSDAEVDEALVKYFDRLFFGGEQAHKGERTLAAWMDQHPSLGRLGGRRLPRAWRALKGWRRLTPGRSRRPMPLCFWCAVAARMSMRGKLSMGLFVLLTVSTYLRPGEAMGLLKEDLLRSAAGASSRWALLVNPERRGLRSKTGTSDDSIALDSSWLRWLEPVLEVLCDGAATESLWNFNYADFLKEFRVVLGLLKVRDVVPYQMRHSGASIDRSKGWRSQDEVMKRGRWQAHRSLTRYEKHARLQLSMNQLSGSQRDYFLECERHIADIILGRRHGVTAAPVLRT